MLYDAFMREHVEQWRAWGVWGLCGGNFHRPAEGKRGTCLLARGPEALDYGVTDDAVVTTVVDGVDGEDRVQGTHAGAGAAGRSSVASQACTLARWARPRCSGTRPALRSVPVRAVRLHCAPHMARSSTYSIVACDLERREWGVAVQSRFLAIGALAVWAEAEVGAVATQSFMNTDYGRDGLRLISQGLSAREALDRVLAQDPEPEKRQVGVVDREATVAAHTGESCMDWAGHRLGASFAAQGNMLVSADTVDALADAFVAANGSLARRLLAALVAAQAAGGDRRGQQSAALLIARRGGGYGGADVALDLRVDDDPAPLRELERLLGLHELYFGSTPTDRWLPVAGALHAEVRRALDRLGYTSGDLAGDLETWAGIENLEERVEGAARIDPVVLAALRRLVATPAGATKPQTQEEPDG